MNIPDGFFLIFFRITSAFIHLPADLKALHESFIDIIFQDKSEETGNNQGTPGEDAPIVSHIQDGKISFLWFKGDKLSAR